MELSLAFAKRQGAVELKLRAGGISTSSTTPALFDNSQWVTSPDYRVEGDLLPIASDGPTSSSDSSETLAMKCHKLCLRFKKAPQP